MKQIMQAVIETTGILGKYLGFSGVLFFFGYALAGGGGKSCAIGGVMSLVLFAASYIICRIFDIE